MTSAKVSLLGTTKALKRLNVEHTKSLMFHLGVQINDLDDIQVMYHDANSQKIHLVQKWLEIDVDASWEKLFRALQDIEMHSLAVEIKLEYIPNATVEPLIHNDDSRNPVTTVSSVVESSEEKVKEKIEYLEDEFFKLKSDTRASLSDREKKDEKFLELFCDFLLELPVAKRVIHVKFFRESEDEILEAKNIRKVFAILGRYCNYSNYEIIVHVIKKFGSVELKARMLHYCDSIKKFEVGTAVAIYLKAISAQPSGEVCKGFTRMAMKINKSIHDCSLHEIRQLKEAMAENASVHTYSMYIESLAESSVLVVLRIHSACAEQVYAAMTPDFTYFNLIDNIEVTPDFLPKATSALATCSKTEKKISENYFRLCSPTSSFSTTSHDKSTKRRAEENYHTMETRSLPPLPRFMPPIPIGDRLPTLSPAVVAPPRLQVVMTEDDEDWTGDSGMETGSGSAQFLLRSVPSDNAGYAPLTMDEVTVNQYTQPNHPSTRRALYPKAEPSTGELNRSVLLEVVRVLESPKVQEMELAQRVRAMLPQSTLPTVVEELNETGKSGKYKILDIDRAEAERLLRNDEEGTFLIRDGYNKGGCDVVLSVKLTDKVDHFRIYKDKDLRYCFEGLPSYDTLDELIDNLNKDAMTIKNSKYILRLGSPFVVL